MSRTEDPSRCQDAPDWHPVSGGACDYGPQHVNCVVITSLARNLLNQPALSQEPAGVENEYFP